MANEAFPKTELIGGGANAVDGISGYANGDIAFVFRNGTLIPYKVDTSLSGTEDIPARVTPDSGSGRWMWAVPGGTMVRPRFEYSSTSAIKISAGIYPIYGASNLQAAVIADEITYTISSLAADDISYIYLDMSDIETNGHPVITTAELYDATAEPSFDADRGGWYHASTTDDLCIWGAPADGSGNQYVFKHNGGRMVYLRDRQAVVVVQDIDTTPVTADFGQWAPVFSGEVLAEFSLDNNGATAATSIIYESFGDSDDFAYIASTGTHSGAKDKNSCLVPVDASQRGQVRHSASNAAESGVRINGWVLGAGM